MPEEYLQTAFEIKASCDEISRRLLRWHWEQKPGAHTMAALLEHLERRRAESPVYYDRLPALEKKTSWQQLDTTLCMRVLLDPEKDAARPLDLLGNTAHPAAARRACNAVRTARNEAAHAADRAGALEAALRFNEAVECLEDGYLGTALGEKELAGYYRQAESYLARCKGEKQVAKQPEVKVYPTGAAREKAAAARSSTAAKSGTAAKSSAAPARKPASGGTAKSAKSKSTSASGTRRKSSPASGTSARKSGTAKRTAQRGRKKSGSGISGLFWVLAVLALAAGLLLRARAMGYLPF